LQASALTIRGATLLTVAGPLSAEAVRGWLSVSHDGRLSALEAGEPPASVLDSAEEVVHADGLIVAPGFVSAHSHLFTSGSRGLGASLGLYSWIEAMTRYSCHADEADIYWLCRHGAADFLDCGITTAYDFSANRLGYSARRGSFGSFGGTLRPLSFSHAQLEAKLDSGLRFFHSVCLDEAWTESPHLALDSLESQLAMAEPFFGHPRMLGMAISGGVQWAPDPALAALEAAAMDRYGLINQPHFLESPEGVDAQQARFAWYRQAGALGPRLIFGHFIHTTPALVAEAAAAGAAMSWQPASNGRLGSGIADVVAYLEAGMRVGMGLDDQSCTDVADPWQNMRVGLFMQRAARQDAAALDVRQVLELHTMGSARALGVDSQVGSLEVGKWADLLVVDPLDPDVGPLWDPYASYVLACGLRNLKQVRVGGKVVSEGGRNVVAGNDKLSCELHSRLARIATEHGLPQALHQ